MAWATLVGPPNDLINSASDSIWFMPLLNTMFNVKVKHGVYNNVFNHSTISFMQPSMKLLYETAAKKDVNTPSAIARVMGATPQMLKNWESRGISREGAMNAQLLFGLDSNALLALNVKSEPEPKLRAYKTTEEFGAKPLIAQDSARPTLKMPSYDKWTVEAIKIFSELKPAQKEGAVSVLRTFVEHLGPPIKSSLPAANSTTA